MKVKVCAVHTVHRPRVADIDVHHIWPVGMGGPDVPANRVVICPTGHRNIHELLREYVRLRGAVPWELRRGFSPEERRLAQLGWDRAQRKAL